MFYVLGTFVATMLLGAMAIGLFAYARRWGRGTWPAYLIIFGLTMILLVVVGVVLIMTMPDVPGPPGDEVFKHIIGGACCVAAAPGLGMVAGLLGLLFRRPGFGRGGPPPLRSVPTE